MNVDNEIQQRLKDTEDHFTERKENAHEHRIRETIRLAIDGLIAPKGNDHFDITNLGAILFAKELSQFANLERKAFRVIRYKGI